MKIDAASPTARLPDRQQQLLEIQTREPWDMLVIGGGATGLGIAVDAASRGYRVALVEQHDFGKGTSSRSTKLIHGGVRYLEQGNISLVRDALRERGRLLANAPHLVHPLPTVLPLYKWWEPYYYRLGLFAYDTLAGRAKLEPSSRLSSAEVANELPTIRTGGLRGAVRYLDAAFDDARLIVNLAQTAWEHGAVCLNYVRVKQLLHEDGRTAGAVVTDVETDQSWPVSAKVVVNATGPFSDAVRQLDDPDAKPLIAFSQGIHLVLPQSVLPGESAMIIPKTSDGRVAFAIPWNGHTLVGTTDTPLNAATLEPRPQIAEVDFLLETLAEYLDYRPNRLDVLSVFAGIRPLVSKSNSENTAQLDRDHQIHVSRQGLVSIVGGKWTTYRKMAEDCVDRAIEVAALPAVACRSQSLAIHGSASGRSSGPLSAYGCDAEPIGALMAEDASLAEPLDVQLPYTTAQVVWGVRHEMARTVEDVLARRLRALFLNAAAAVRCAPKVAEVIARQRGLDTDWANEQVAAFGRLATNYSLDGLADNS